MSDHQAPQPDPYAEFIASLRGRKPDELTLGFESPHRAHRFAEQLALGSVIKEKLDAVSTIESPDPRDVAVAKLDAAQGLPEYPLGEEFTKAFLERYGKAPYVETYAVEGRAVAANSAPSSNPASNIDPSLQEILSRDPAKLTQAESQKIEQEQQRRM